MKVLFLGIGSEQLGISQLASIVKEAGHEIDLAFTASLFHDRFNLEIPWLNRFFDETNVIIKDIIEKKPDVIAFGALTATFQWSIKIIKEVKKHHPHIKTIFGGVHTSAVPEVCLSYDEVDYAVVGEGEQAILDILEDIQAGGRGLPINNTQYLDNNGQLVKGRQVGFHQELDEFPYPEKTIWEPYVNLRDNYLILASRGCPYTCTFCFNNFFARLPEGKRGKYVRHRSVAHVIGELKWAKERYKLKSVDFQDDVFTVDKQWLLEFCEVYQREIALPFNILVHAKYFDEEIAKALSDAGCKWIQMGIQSMDEDFKTNILQRREKSEQIILALELMKKYKLKVKVDQMLALPGEAIDAQEKALNLYKKYTPYRIQTFWTAFLPGTEMLFEAYKDGIVNDEELKRLNHGEDFYFFRNQDNIKNPELVRIYVNYEFIYRILPSMPRFIRERMTESSVAWIPRPIKNFLGQIIDVYAGFKDMNVEFSTYAIFYLKNIFKFYLRKIGYSNYRIAKVYANTPIPKVLYLNGKVVQLNESNTERKEEKSNVSSV
ncbi:MAG: B12-binding domain-containing radical SAM protein [Chitinophagales bacterium]|nr:B12-binding domain-containing radical SAM protein [Chitinophagales bacterium]